jgi:hypothetical protein
MAQLLPPHLRLTDAQIDYWAERYLSVPILGARGITFEAWLALPIERRDRLSAGLEPWPALLPRQIAVRDACFEAERQADALPRRGGAPFEKLTHVGHPHRRGKSQFRPLSEPGRRPRP